MEERFIPIKLNEINFSYQETFLPVLEFSPVRADAHPKTAVSKISAGLPGDRHITQDCDPFGERRVSAE